MKLMSFSKEKAMLMLGVLVVMVILWSIQRWFSKSVLVESNTSMKNYQSMQIRRLPCGRFLKRVVEVEGATGVKSTQLLDRDGVTVLKEKRMPIDLGDCTAISNGTFVPELWKDCQVAV